MLNAVFNYVVSRHLCLVFLHASEVSQSDVWCVLFALGIARKRRRLDTT